MGNEQSRPNKNGTDPISLARFNSLRENAHDLEESSSYSLSPIPSTPLSASLPGAPRLPCLETQSNTGNSGEGDNSYAESGPSSTSSAKTLEDQQASQIRPWQEERLKGDYRQALERGKVKLAYSRVMLLGAGGVGKSSLQRGLMNQRLVEANSTQLADISTITLSHWAKSGNKGEEHWRSVEEDDEVHELVGLVQLVVNMHSGRCKTPHNRFVSMMKAGIDGLASAIRVNGGKPTKYDCILQEVLTRAIKILQENPNMQASENEVFMHVWDCGGQPIFLSILPAFLTDKTMFLLVFDARNNLHDRCIALSHYKDRVISESAEEVTTMEFLLQWMSCIDATLSSRKNDGGSLNNYPQILPVGTHGDDADVQCSKEETIEQLYSEYKDKACAQLLPTKGVVVDNTTAGKGEKEDVGYKKIRSIVHKFALEDLAIDTPLTWVLFRIVLRKVAKTNPCIPIDEIKEIAKACSIEEKSLASVLQFYHGLGIFLHYSHIPSLKSQVIANPQWLIDQMAKLFSPIETETSRNPSQSDILSKKGILVQPLYEQIWKFSEHNQELKAQAIIDLLEHFLIVAPIDTRSRVHQFRGKEYFVPAALQLLPLSQETPTGTGEQVKKAAPLHLIFDTKYLPPGFFTRLATSLSKQPKCQVAFSQGIYRNRVSFLFGDAGSEIDTITITERTCTVQIDITRDAQRQAGNPFFFSVCQSAMKTIQACCADVRQWVPLIKASVALRCTNCTPEDADDEHFVDLTVDLTTTSTVRCQKEKPCGFNTEQKYWLQVGQVIVSPTEKGSCMNDHEIEVIAAEVVGRNKIAELADALEMTVHLPLAPSNIIKRWQKEMKMMNLSARHYLIHHLICIGMNEIARKLRYCEIDSGEQNASSFTEAIPRVPLTDSDFVSCSKSITEGKIITKLAGYLDVTNQDLETVKSKYKDTEAQSYQILKEWHAKCPQKTKDDLINILKTIGCNEASKQLSGRSPTLEDLLNHVKTTSYYHLGLGLGLPDHTLNVIEQNNRNDVEKALRIVFQKWLEMCPHPSWVTVFRALTEMGENRIAKNIQETFL